jgi:four helix bundle protein
MKICLKELRETMICLKIISRKPLVPQKDTDPVLKECNELISIFVKSIQTAQNREK